MDVHLHLLLVREIKELFDGGERLVDNIVRNVVILGIEEADLAACLAHLTRDLLAILKRVGENSRNVDYGNRLKRLLRRRSSKDGARAPLASSMVMDVLRSLVRSARDLERRWLTSTSS